MRKNRLFILGIITVMVALVSLSLVSSTFAKYTSTAATATDEARVAKWDVQVNDKTLNGSNVITFDLFSTINDTGNTAAETDVTSSNSDTVIAPGTAGSVSFKVANLSEVTADITIAVTESNSNSIPLVFTVGSEATTYSTVAAALKAALGLNDEMTETLAVGASAQEVTINWSWPFYVSAAQDGTDTTLGLAGSAKYSVSLNITATQVD